MAIEKEFTLKVSTEVAQKNVDELNKSLTAQENLIDGLEEELFKYETQLKKTSKANLAGRKKINDQITKTKDALRLEKKGLKDVNKERKVANETLKESSANAADYSGVLGAIDRKTGGAVSGFTNLTKSVGGATKGLNLMKIALIGTGIGALLILLTSLTSAFTSSEEGQNKFAKMMAIIGTVTAVFTDKLSALGRGLINLFTDPIETLKGFGNSIKEFVMDKVDLAVESLGFMGSAISKLFSGDFSGALEDAGKGVTGLVRATNPLVMITEALIDGTKNLVKEISKEAKIAGEIADARAEAVKLERGLIVERAEANRKRAELLDKAAQKEKFNATERIAFLKEAAVIEEEITNKEVALAQIRLDAKIKENALGDSTIDDLTEEANLRANLINLETAKLRKAKAVTAQIVGAEREAAAERKAIGDQEIKDAKAISDFKKGLIEVDKNNKIAAIEKEKEDRIIAIESLKLSEEAKNQMLLDVDKAFREKKKVIEEEQKIIDDEKLAQFLEKEIGEKELTLEEEKQEALNKALRLGASEADMLGIKNKYRKIEENNEAQKEAAKLNMASVGFGKMAEILGKNSKAGKAAAAASALINTYQGITAELATKTVTPFGFAMKLVNIASVAAIGFKSVKSILATNTESGGGAATNPASGTAGGGGGGSEPPQPPAFNVVGATPTNQLADAIGSQEQQPVQAFVVSGDVTTAQSLERNIVQGATIG
tara:strand:- start:57 stop:2213 length:2157 start_codon:yes stop_codon:yes gene_type:complete